MTRPNHTDRQTDPLVRAYRTEVNALTGYFKNKGARIESVEELLSETQYRMVKRRDQFPPDRAGRWIQTIAKWIFWEHCRKKKRRPVRFSEMEARSGSDGDPLQFEDKRVGSKNGNPSDIDNRFAMLGSLADRERTEKIWSAVRHLEDGNGLYRMLFVLHYLERVPLRSLGRAFTLGRSAIRMRMREAREAFSHIYLAGYWKWYAAEDRVVWDDIWHLPTDWQQQGARLAVFGRIDHQILKRLRLPVFRHHEALDRWARILSGGTDLTD